MSLRAEASQTASLDRIMQFDVTDGCHSYVFSRVQTVLLLRIRCATISLLISLATEFKML
jgi:hypothetical protein